MTPVFLAALGVGLGMYGLIRLLPRFSPRRELIRRLGTEAAEAAVMVPRLVASPRRRRMARLCLDWIALLSALLRSGASVRAALEGSRHGLGWPLRHQVDRLVLEVETEGIRPALERFADRTDSPEARTVVLLLAHHAELGGDLPTALDSLEAHVLAAVRHSPGR